MDRGTFRNGMKDLKLFFRTFTPTAPQLEAWFSRLKNFENDAMRIAIHEITTADKVPPSFSRVLSELFKAQKKLAARQEIDVEVKGRYAPRSDQKYEMQAAFMGELYSLLGMKDPEARKNHANTLKELWHKRFAELPGVITQDQAEGLVNSKNWPECERYGIVTQIPGDSNVFIPMFESEKNTGCPTVGQ